MEILNDVLKILGYTPEECNSARADLDFLIKAKVTDVLITKLSSDALGLVEDITDVESESGQEQLGKIIKENFSQEQIEEEEKKAFAEVFFAYAEYMLEKSDSKTQEKLKTFLHEKGFEI